MKEPRKGDTIVVWFSCGAASAVAAKKTIELFGSICTIRLVNNPVKEEHPDNLRFLSDVERWLGIKVETALNSKYKNASAVEVWEDRNYMSGTKGAPCTTELKKKARYEWEIKNRADWHVLGFTSEEKHRYDKFILRERPNTIHVLKSTSKAECFELINMAGIELPEIYKMGYPNANCIGCVKATSVTYWNHVRKMHPAIFKERAEQSREIGCRLTRHKGKRLFLDELPEDAKGHSMKNMQTECGIFCFKD